MGAREPDGPKESARRGRKPAPREARCDVDIGRGKAKIRRYGTAAIADDALHFHTGRGGRQGQDLSLRVPLEEIRKITCDGPAGLLTVEAAEPEVMVLHLGRIAPDWKRMLEERHDPHDALGVAPTSRVALVGVDDDELTRHLTARVRGFAGDNPEGSNLDFLFVGAAHRSDLSRLRALAERVRRPGGVVWVLTAARGPTPHDIDVAARDSGLVPGGTETLSSGRSARRLIRV